MIPSVLDLLLAMPDLSPAPEPTNATAIALIETAERLFARDGIEGVSLRQIRTAAGSSNATSVQYHFGDKAGLVRAIFAYRLPHLDQVRARMLQENPARSVANMARILFLPISHVVSSEGTHDYAGFLASLVMREQGEFRVAEHPLAPVTLKVGIQLRDLLGPLDEDAKDRRVRAAILVFLDGLSRIDRKRATRPDPDTCVNDYLAMAIGVLTAPCA